MLEDLVVVGARGGVGADVDRHGGESWDLVQQPVVGVGGDVVSCCEVEALIDDDPCFGCDAVPGSPAATSIAGDAYTWRDEPPDPAPQSSASRTVAQWAARRPGWLVRDARVGKPRR